MVDYDTLVDTFKAELTQTERFKKDMIVKLAKQLEKEKETPLEEINDKISNDLEGYVSRNYIGQCLPDKYKQVKKAVHKSKKKVKVQVTTDGTEITDNDRDKDVDKIESREFHEEFNQQLETRTQLPEGLDSLVLKELDEKRDQVKNLNKLLETTINPDEYKDLEQKLTTQEDIITEFRNHVGAYVQYDKSLNIIDVRPTLKSKIKGRVTIDLKRFEEEIKTSFSKQHRFADIDYNDEAATSWH